MLTEMTHLALPTAWNTRRPSEPAHLNSVKSDMTDRPPAYPGPTIAGGCCPWWSAHGTQVFHREADWSTAPAKGHFDEFH